jgi:DNA-binding MarR family transcriptional regulator
MEAEILMMKMKSKHKRNKAPSAISVPRSFARLSKLDPTSFRILIHAHTYRTGWKPKKCVRECGISLSSVQRAVKRLKEMGYIYTVPHPVNPRLRGYRFRFAPNLPDEKKPWFKEMMRENNGAVDGVVFMPKIDDGEWKKPDKEGN